MTHQNNNLSLINGQPQMLLSKFLVKSASCFTILTGSMHSKSKQMRQIPSRVELSKHKSERSRHEGVGVAPCFGSLGTRPEALVESGNITVDLHLIQTASCHGLYSI